jgi:hypothetical protein
MLLRFALLCGITLRVAAAGAPLIDYVTSAIEYTATADCAGCAAAPITIYAADYISQSCQSVTMAIQ